MTIENVISAAKQHGEDSEPDHEVGDLQDALREAWARMSRIQRIEYLNSNCVKEILSYA